MTIQSNEAKKPHSADYFGEYRDFWWNLDFLQLMAKRLGLEKAESVLDVGCGIGHWGQLLANVLPANAKVVGVDREDLWVERARARAEERGLGSRYRYQKGDATHLPFPDHTFDLVTCQTVLIHLKDPRDGMREMLRVLKPGGRFLAAEPNNFSNSIAGSSLTAQKSIDEAMAMFRFVYTCERGKQALGLGYNSAGDLIPGYLSELGAKDVCAYLSDKAIPLFAPYSTPEQQANVRQTLDWADRDFLGWDDEEAHRYFIAGGGSDREFAAMKKAALLESKEVAASIRAGTFHSGGGGIFYLVSGTKPESARQPATE